MKKIDTFVLGMVQVNTYVVWQDQHVLIIDPGSKSQKLQDCIAQGGGIVDAIVLTHAHFDHIAGVDALVDVYHCPLYINEYDIPLLQNPQLNFSLGQKIVVHTVPRILTQGAMQIGAFSLQIIDAPGHSEGCSMIQWDQNLFCGDVVFAGSIGRCDLATSSNTKMKQSLSMMKETLDADVILYPGHGPKTTWKEELLHNPFLQF